MVDKKLIADKYLPPSRRRFLTGGIAGLVGLSIPRPLMAALAEAPRRSIKLRHARTGERLNTIFYEDGNYLPEALDEIDYFMRDERAPEMMVMDRKLIELLSIIQHKLEVSQPFLVTSGYRTHETNQMLAAKGRRVSRESYHIYGKATDFMVPGRTPSQVAALARSLEGGGVGQYRSFVHIDTGPVRSWGRKLRQQVPRRAV